jgi:hypothetical protein
MFALGQKRIYGPAERFSVKTLDVGARDSDIAIRGGINADHMDFVRHFAVRVFPHVNHHPGDCLAYPPNIEERARSLLAPLNVLFSCHCRYVKASARSHLPLAVPLAVA